MSHRSLHRPSLIPPDEEQHTADGPRLVALTSANHSVAATPFPISTMRPFTPCTSQLHGEPFTAKITWKGVISGIRAIQRLRITGGMAEGPMGKLHSDLVVVTGHNNGNLMVWSADSLHAIGSCQHFNNVNVVQVEVTKSLIITRVERNASTGKPGDDDEIHVWDLTTMTRKFALTGHEDRVSAFSVPDDDGNTVVSGGVDKHVLVWDLSHPQKPVAKLEGHGSTVTHIISSGTLAVSASSDGVMKAWNLMSKSLIATVEGHSSSICVMHWMKPFAASVRELQAKRRGTGSRRGSQANLLEDAAPADEELPVATLVTACVSGTLRIWNVSKEALESPWTVKAHRALITDVAWDDDIFVTATSADPAVAFHRIGRTGAARGHTGGDVGVRKLAIDRNRKMVVSATDSGALVFFSYKPMADAGVTAASPMNDFDQLQVLLSIQPHVASVSNLLLERAENSQWERLVSVANDNTIFCMDFDVNRDSKSYHSEGSRAAVVIDFNGSYVTTSGNTIAVWDPEGMTRKNIPRRTIEGHTDRITCLAYSRQMRRLITGSADGSARLWDVIEVAKDASADEPSSPGASASAAAASADESYRCAAKIDLEGMVVTCVAEPVGDITVVGGQRPGSRTGSAMVVNIATGVPLLNPVALHTFPCAAFIMLQPGPESAPAADADPSNPGRPDWWIDPVTPPVSSNATPSGSPDRKPSTTSTAAAAPRHFYALLQLRSGEVVIYGGTVSPSLTAFPLRSVIPQQMDFSYEMEATLPEPIPILAWLDNSYTPPRIGVVHAPDDNHIRLESVVPPRYGKDDAVQRNSIWAAELPAPVSALCLVNHSNVAVAVATDVGLVRMFSKSGDIAVDVHFDGAVDDSLNAGAVGSNRRRCYYRPMVADPSTRVRFPSASAIASSAEARCVAMGYRDGTVQVFDFIQRRICRRICAHGTVIRTLSVNPIHPRIISTSVAQALRFDSLYGRHIAHQGSTNPAAIKAAFQQQQQQATQKQLHH